MGDLAEQLKRWEARMACRKDPESVTHNAQLRADLVAAEARAEAEEAQAREWARESQRMSPRRYGAAHYEHCAVSRHYNIGWVGKVPPPPPCTCDNPHWGQP